MTNNTILPIGTLVNNGTYRIEEQLRSGGFGNTYKVRRLSFDETYAMKEFFMKSVNLRTDGKVTVSVPDNKTTFKSQKDKFREEALRLRKIKNEHIVHVEDYFEENGTAYYIMEYIDGRSLSEITNQSNTPMPESQVEDILHQLLDALRTIHSATPHLYHLDIKPSNIMYDHQGKVRLIDFGASKQISAEESSHFTLSTMCYTPEYAPTEQKEQTGSMIGPWTDFYALGGTLYKLLTLHLPPSNTALINQGEKAFLYPTSVSMKMRQLIAWMMKPQLSLRPQSVDEIMLFLNGQQQVSSEETHLDEESTRMDVGVGGSIIKGDEHTQKPAQKTENTFYDYNDQDEKSSDVKEKLLPDKWPWYMNVGGVVIIMMCLVGLILCQEHIDFNKSAILSIAYIVTSIFTFFTIKKKEFGFWGMIATAILIMEVIVFIVKFPEHHYYWKNWITILFWNNAILFATLLFAWRTVKLHHSKIVEKISFKDCFKFNDKNKFTSIILIITTGFAILICIGCIFILSHSFDYLSHELKYSNELLAPWSSTKHLFETYQGFFMAFLVFIGLMATLAKKKWGVYCFSFCSFLAVIIYITSSEHIPIPTLILFVIPFIIYFSLLQLKKNGKSYWSTLTTTYTDPFSKKQYLTYIIGSIVFMGLFIIMSLPYIKIVVKKIMYYYT